MGSSQAADGTFPANSIALRKNTCIPSQGQDPIRAAPATADAVQNERRILKIKVNCDKPVWGPGFPRFPQHPQERAGSAVPARGNDNPPARSRGFKLAQSTGYG